MGLACDFHCGRVAFNIHCGLGACLGNLPGKPRFCYFSAFFRRPVVLKAVGSEPPPHAPSRPDSTPDRVTTNAWGPPWSHKFQKSFFMLSPLNHTYNSITSRHIYRVDSVQTRGGHSQGLQPRMETEFLAFLSVSFVFNLHREQSTRMLRNAISIVSVGSLTKTCAQKVIKLRAQIIPCSLGPGVVHFHCVFVALKFHGGPGNLFGSLADIEQTF